jgi:hypothetical protein
MAVSNVEMDIRILLTRIIQCAVKGLLMLAGANPARQLVAPTGSTQSGSRRQRSGLKHSWKRPLGESASTEAITRVNAEQASKRVMREPTCLHYRAGRRHSSETSDTTRAVPPGEWRWHACKRNRPATREAPAVRAREPPRALREEPARLDGVAERPGGVRTPGHAGRAQGP